MNERERRKIFKNRRVLWNLFILKKTDFRKEKIKYLKEISPSVRNFKIIIFMCYGRISVDY